MRTLLLTVLALAANGFASFKIIAIPDTQRMAQYYPARMKGQTQWIVNHVATENIAFVTHLGDVVDEGYDLTQWGNATAALNLLDGVVPYSVCIGNHDYHDRTDRLDGAAEYIARFGSSRYSGYPWYKGSHRELDHYQIFSADGREWLHLNLEYQPDSESLLWAQRVLDAHPDLPAIMSTHAFLSKTGLLGVNPSASEFGVVSNGGEAQWAQFVKQNDQIFLVMNGHYFAGSDGVAHTNIVNSFGHDVFMMCIDYQGVSDYDAHLRILEFDSSGNKINLTTYDPNTSHYLTSSEDRFSLNLDFSTRLTHFTARETFSTVQAANITVVENDLNNAVGSVTVSIPAGQSTEEIFVVPAGTTTYTDHSNGDYYIRAGSILEDDKLGGVMVASVAENGRTSIDGSNYYHIVQAVAGGHGQYSIATATAANTNQYPGYYGGAERDVNFSVAYFPFDQGWTAGRVETYNDNTPFWTFVGSENITPGVHLTQIPQGDVDINLLQKVGGPTASYWRNPEAYRGIWNLEIPGVNSILDGILYVCGGKNENNYAAASPRTDGSGWQISVQDSGGSGGTESDPWNFVYVPYVTENIVAGRLRVKAPCVILGTPGFTAIQNASGAVRLDIAGYTPADGTLIVSTENEGFGSDDFTTYEPEGDHWIIETKDLPGATLSSAMNAQFAFLFIPFASAPAGPGTRPDYGVDYDNSIHWNGAGGWMDVINWTETPERGAEWGIPGWVVGNPVNTTLSTNLTWNGGYAHVDSGTVDVTSGSKPDGSVSYLYLGSNAGDTTLNIGTDFTVRGKIWMGYQSTASDVSTVNQAAGIVVLGATGAARTYLGRGFGKSVYNLSGGTLETLGDWDQFGNNVDDADDGTSTFIFNQTGGIYTDAGANELIMADKVQGTTVVNVSAGTFQANATARTRVASHGTATINISGSGAVETASATFDLGYYSDAAATLNLSNGAFTATGTYLNVGKGGAGVVNQSGGDANITRLILAEDTGSSGLYSISGGSLVAANYIAGHSGAGVFEIVGSDATSIETDTAYFWEDTFRVVLDDGGSTLFEAVGGAYGGGIDLRNALFEVDTLASFDGVVGDTYDVMWTADGFQISTGGTNNFMVFSNLSGTDFGWDIVAKDGGEVFQLVVLGETPTETWAVGYGLVGGDAAAIADPDEDGVNNLYEYGLGGNPTNAVDQGISPSYYIAQDGGANGMIYVYPKRSALDSGLTYSLELNNDLVSGTWTNAGYTMQGLGAINSDFDAVTNWISSEIEGRQFIRLIIKEE